MRILLPLLAAALFLPLAQPAVAQSASGDGAVTHLLDDATGDVKVLAGGQAVDPAGRFQAADVKGLDVKETEQDVTFTVTVASLSESPEAPFFETVVYRVGFAHHDRDFRVLLVRNVFQSATYSAQLQAYDAGRHGYYSLTKMGPAVADVGAGTISATFGRDLLVDAEGNAPQPQVPFTGWHVTATNIGTNFFGGGQGGQVCLGGANCQGFPNVQATDQMPDTGNGTLDLTLKFGLVQSGHARLSSPTPTRASNGEATTIVYQVTAHNLGAKSEMFMLGSSGAPGGWDVQLPAEHVTIPGNGTLVFPVLLTMPFTHQHGTYQFFLVTLTSMQDSGSVGRVQLGVRFSNPPQPAGHHNALWLHTADASNFFDQLPAGGDAADPVFGTGAALFMNALDTDPLDAGLPVPGQGCNFALASVPPRVSYCWDVPLSPGLEIGLSFDLNKTGKVSIPFTTTPPLLGAQLSGELLYYPPANATANRQGGLRPGPNGAPVDNSEVLAQLSPSPPVDLQAGTTAPTFLTADLKPTVLDPYIPYVKGASLLLRLQLDATSVNLLQFPNQQTPPFVQPGGTVTDLPLFEYHDRVNQLFAASSSLMLSADSALDRMANPGEAVLFNLTLMNHGSAPATVDLVLRGTHGEWAQRLLPKGSELSVPAGGSVPVSIAIAIPKDAAPDSGAGAGHGDMADLVLQATGTTDLNQRALARLHVMVDNSRAWPDDTATIHAIQGVGAKKSTPGLEVPLLLAGLALALLARRRLD